MDDALFIFFFFFNNTATTEIYTLPLHDALPILGLGLLETVIYVRIERVQGNPSLRDGLGPAHLDAAEPPAALDPDRKSTRLNSSHANISYAVFCLKKKKQTANKCCQQLSKHYTL